MRFATVVGEPVGDLADRFARWVGDGRGDLARGRNLHLLRFLDALWEPSGPLCVPYRPTRNPAAFLAMTFDLASDHRHGYRAQLDSTALPQAEALTRVRAHVRERLDAPWSDFVDELCASGLPNLGRVVAETITSCLERPAVSSLPAFLARLPTLLTPAQLQGFDADEFVRSLRLEEVFAFLGFPSEPTAAPRKAGREQHPTGGDLRSALRRRLDDPWFKAMSDCTVSPTVAWSGPSDAPLDFLASWPVDIGWLAASAGAGEVVEGARGDTEAGVDFAVAYALATDAPPPGRDWPAPAPYVADDARGEFESLAARDEDATLTRRATLLERWGVSALLPRCVGLLDERLASGAGLTPLHAGGRWVDAVGDVADALEVARRGFLQRVADVVHHGGSA